MEADNKRESGITLVETLIAIIVLLTGMMTLAQVLMLSVMASKTHGRDAGKATVIARDKMEELSALPIADVRLADGGSLDPAAREEGYYDFVDQGGNVIQAGNIAGAAEASAAYTRYWSITDEEGLANGRKRIAVAVTSNKSFRYGTAPSTVMVTQKTP